MMQLDTSTRRTRTRVLKGGLLFALALVVWLTIQQSLPVPEPLISTEGGSSARVERAAEAAPTAVHPVLGPAREDVILRGLRLALDDGAPLCRVEVAFYSIPDWSDVDPTAGTPPVDWEAARTYRPSEKQPLHAILSDAAGVVQVPEGLAGFLEIRLLDTTYFIVRPSVLHASSLYGASTTVYCREGARLSGKVVDTAGVVVVGAEVLIDYSAQLLFEGREASLNEIGAFQPGAVRRAVSDSEGFILKGLLAKAPTRVDITHPGYAPLTIQVDPLSPSEDRAVGDVVLSAGLTAAVQLVDHLGAPLSGAVQVWAAEGPVPATEIRTDSGGNALFKGLGEGRYFVRGEASEHSPRRVVLDVKPSLAPLLLVLESARRITGTVVSRKRGAVAGASVIAFAPYGHWRATTDQQGRFMFDELPFSQVRLVATAEGFVASDRVALASGGGDCVIELRDGCMIRGQVYRERGVHFDGSSIMVRAALLGSFGRSDNRYRSTICDATGRFVLGPFQDGEYRMTADGEMDGGESTVQVSGADADLEIQLQDKPLANGVVLEGRTGKPIAGASVALDLVSTDKPGSWIFAFTREGARQFACRSGADGAFRLRVKAAGENWLRVAKSGFRPLRLPARPGMQIRLERVPLLTGRIEHSNGLPAAGARLLWVKSPRVNGLASADGRYEIEQPAREEGLLCWTSMPFTWRVVSSAQAGRIVLPAPECAVRGLLRVNGLPGVGVAITLHAIEQADAAPRLWMPSLVVRSNERGEFRLENIRAGHYLLRAIIAGRVLSHAVTAVAGEEAAIMTLSVENR